MWFVVRVGLFVAGASPLDNFYFAADVFVVVASEFGAFSAAGFVAGRCPPIEIFVVAFGPLFASCFPKRCGWWGHLH